jgi:tetratricopeptide (TPR) repeat protein
LNDVYPWYLNRLGRIYIEQEQYEEARLVLQEALDLASASPEILNLGIPLAQLGEIALFESRLEDAKLLLEKALTSLENSDAIFLAMVRTDLAEIALADKDFPQARKWLEQAYEPARQHIRRTLVFLCALVGYLVLSDRNNDDICKAVELYGAVEFISGKSGIRLNSFYQRLNQLQMEMTREKLSAEEWQQAFETGSGWERDAAIQQARHVLEL